MKVPILVYHSTNIAGNDYGNNDHVALASDLEQIDANGFRILPLHEVVSRWMAAPHSLENEKVVALTCDDGADFDFHDLPHPVAGMQRSMLNILRDFCKRRPDAQPNLFLTSFVIVSPGARAILDREGLIGKMWWNDDWWPDAVRSGMMGIANHSWDHNHHCVPAGRFVGVRRGTFETITTEALADQQIRFSSERLWAMAPNPAASLFAYPFGRANDYLAQEYLPLNASRIGVSAAFISAPEPLTRNSNRWRLPRYVFGRDWDSAAGLQKILDQAARRMPSKTPQLASTSGS